MTMDEQQRERFQAAVDRKKERSKAASEQDRRPDGGRDVLAVDQEPSVIESGRARDKHDERAKSTGHGKKTADKWNQ